jgi:hypothetical protein
MIRSYSFFRQFVSITFFSLLFCVFLWMISSFLMVEQIRTSSLENTHMVVVLDQKISNSDYQKIFGQLSFITTNIKPLSLDEVNQFAQPSISDPISGTTKKMILLTLSMGKNNRGERVTLADQALSIHKILSGNRHVLLVEDNLPWAEKLDSLDLLMIHLKRSGLMLLGLVFLMLILFWSFSGGVTEKDAGAVDPSGNSFWKQSDPSSFSFNREGFRLGFFAALGACILLFLAHPALYSPSLDPFLASSQLGIHSKWVYFFFSFPVIGGGLGWLSFQLGKFWRRVLLSH